METNERLRRLRSARISTGLSREAFAELAGVHENTIWRIETGHHAYKHDKMINALVELCAKNGEKCFKNEDELNSFLNGEGEIWEVLEPPKSLVLFREAMGKLISDVMKELGVASGQISRVERRESKIPEGLFGAFAESYGMPESIIPEIAAVAWGKPDWARRSNDKNNLEEEIKVPIEPEQPPVSVTPIAKEVKILPKEQEKSVPGHVVGMVPSFQSVRHALASYREGQLYTPSAFAEKIFVNEDTIVDVENGITVDGKEVTPLDQTIIEKYAKGLNLPIELLENGDQKQENLSVFAKMSMIAGKYANAIDVSEANIGASKAVADYMKDASKKALTSRINELAK